MSSRLQHLDSTSGGSVGELVYGSDGLLGRVQHAFFQALDPMGVAEGVSARPVIEHLEAAGVLSIEVIMDELVARSLGMSASVYARMDQKISSWPWRLLRSVAPLTSATERAQIRQQFMSERPCCRDSWFSEWLVLLLRDDRTFDEDWCHSLLMDLYQTCMATNMPLENLLAKVKQSVPGTRSKVQADKLMFAGHLTQMMQDHTDRCGSDPRSALRARSTLSKWGVPLKVSNRAHNRLKRQNNHKVTGKMRKARDIERAAQKSRRLRFINRRVAAQPHLSREEKADAFRDASIEWRTAPENLAGGDSPIYADDEGHESHEDCSSSSRGIQSKANTHKN